MTKSVNVLKITRYYDAFGIKKLNHVSRPLELDLNTQLKGLYEKLQYTLFDDDVFTGSTMNFARQLLIYGGFEIDNNYLTYIDRNVYDVYDVLDVLDVRDFIIDKNSLNNGLVIKFYDGEILQVPYIYPFISLYHRANIPTPLLFSLKIWELNKNSFSETNLLKDMSINYQKLFIKLGFTLKDSMISICQFYIDYINKLNKKQSICY